MGRWGRRAGWTAGVLCLSAVAGIAGCGSSLSSSDAGATGAGGSAGGTGGTGSGGGGAGGTGAPLTEAQVQLAAAVATWSAAKSSCATYSYTRYLTSFTGFAAYTDVEIRNDVATRRRYSTSTRDGGLDPLESRMTVWEETGSQVGEHPSQRPVFPASTVEQLFSECATILAADPTLNRINFRADQRGVPLECTSRPINCADDCTFGIIVRDFACAPLSADGGAN